MESSVIFNKTNNLDDNVWDDTVLIRAYDKAINQLKNDQFIATSSSDVTNKNEKKTKNKTENYSNRSRKNDNKKKVKDIKWKIGDHCAGIYTEDGKLYPGVIIDINYKDETCRIRYDYYENEEDKLLNELYESSEYIEPVEDEETASTAQATSKTESKSSLNHKIPLPPPPLPESLVSHFEKLKFNETYAKAVVNENEALFSMLMSWYMSGYHTGYYFGLKQQKPQND